MRERTREDVLAKGRATEHLVWEPSVIRNQLYTLTLYCPYVQASIQWDRWGRHFEIIVTCSNLGLLERLKYVGRREKSQLSPRTIPEAIRKAVCWVIALVILVPGKCAFRARRACRRLGFSLFTSPVGKATPIQIQKQVPGSLYGNIWARYEQQGWHGGLRSISSVSSALLSVPWLAALDQCILWRRVWAHCVRLVKTFPGCPRSWKSSNSNQSYV